MQRQILLVITFFAGLELSAQQTPQFTQFHRNQYLYNPAAAGTYDFWDITLGGRMQWTGLAESPKTTYVYASAPVNFKKEIHNPSLRTSAGLIQNPEIKTGTMKHAVGGLLLADQYGAYRQVKGALTYSLHLPVADGYNLSFGTNLGISSRTFLADKAVVHSVLTGTNITDEVYDQFLVNQGAQSTMDLGIGFQFYSNRLFVGIAADQLTHDFVKFGNTNVYFAPEMHFYGMAGYKFQLNDNLTLTPAVLAKYVSPAPASLDFTAQLEYRESMWFGLSYRNADAIIAMAGMNINRRFKFGYSYDFTVSRLADYNIGGHELVLGLMLGR